jgi:hypothetical protein
MGDAGRAGSAGMDAVPRRADGGKRWPMGRAGRRGPIPSRARRRGAVLAAYLGYAAVVGLFWLRGTFDTPAWTLALAPVAGLVAVVGLSTFCFGRIWVVANAPDADLDERERSVRDRSYRQSYLLVAGAFLLTAVYGAIGYDTGLLWLPRTWNELQAIMGGVLLLTVTLPPAVVAWTEPDPAGEDR